MKSAMSAIKMAVLGEYQRVANELIAITDSKAIVAAVRMLALYVGHYQLRYGPIRHEGSDEIDSPSPTEQQIAERIEAMRVLSAALTLGRASTQPKGKTPLRASRKRKSR